MKANIILKCDGRQDDGFYFCSGATNIILDLEKVEASENYINLIKYLDGVIKIFDGPCSRLGVISNALYKIYEMGYMTDKVHKYIAHFYEMHQRCGITLLCEIKK